MSHPYKKFKSNPAGYLESDKPPKAFVLKGTSDNFRDRQKNVFGELLDTGLQRSSLDEERMEVIDEVEESMEEVTSRGTRITTTRHFRGKESIFKRPQDPISRNFIRNMPDHKKNPHKWTRYTLEDVKEEDMSDRTNARAAFSFLNDLKRRKHTEEEVMKGSEDSGPPKKIVFKKYVKPVVEGAEDAKATFKSSKVVMPEYVVGQKVRKEKKKSTDSKLSSAQLRLDHLNEDEDEDC